MLILIVLTLLASSFGARFEVTQSKPVGKIQLTEGDTLTLSCTSEYRWGWCTFEHLSSGKVCEFVWAEETNNVTEGSCDPGYTFTGNYEKQECAVAIANVTEIEGGMWECHLQEFWKRHEYEVQKAFARFDVTVKGKGKVKKANEETGVEKDDTEVDEEKGSSTTDYNIGASYLGCYRGYILRAAKTKDLNEENKHESPSFCLDECHRQGFPFTLMRLSSCWCTDKLTSNAQQLRTDAFFCQKQCLDSKLCVNDKGTVALSVFEHKPLTNSMGPESPASLTPSQLSSLLRHYDYVLDRQTEARKMLKDTEMDLDRATKHVESKKKDLRESQEQLNKILASCPEGRDDEDHLDEQIKATLAPLPKIISRMEQDQNDIRDNQIRMVMLEDAIKDIKKDLGGLDELKQHALEWIFSCSLPT